MNDSTDNARTAERDRPKVFLVDDDEDLVFVLRAHMVSVGYNVATAYDAESALAQITVDPPDVMIVDYTLPGMNGIEAIRRIKDNPATADIAIIMITARSATDQVVMALEAGAQEYVVKPFEVAELLARIRTVYRLRQTKCALNDLNGKLITQVEDRTSRLRTLYHFTRALNEADTREEILDLTINAVKEVTGSQRISILVAEPDGQHLICARAAGIDQKVVQSIRVPAREGIAGRVFTSGKTYVASAYQENRDSASQYESECFVSTPLIAASLMTSEEKLGVLSITDKVGGGAFASDEVECIRSIADSGAIALHNHIRRERLNESVNVLLMTVGRLAEFRDNETSRHLERVREYARILAQELRTSSKYQDLITDELIENIYLAAPMHDIGKVGIPDDILCKPAQLTPAEFEVMKEHCPIGREVMESALKKTGPVPILKMCTEIAASHHERWDGTGYPDGLSGETIPLSARIIALVDAYDAITSARRYKGAVGHDQAVEIIQADAGTHFDPGLIQPFLRCADQFDGIRRTHRDSEITQQNSEVTQRELTPA